MHHLIGIDPGTQCGWAVLTHDGKRISSGVWNLRPRRHESSGYRYVRLAKALGELLDLFPTAHLAYEEVARHRGTAAAHIYGGIIATVQSLCEERKVPYVGAPVGTVKRLATGKGNANKKAVMGATRIRWKYLPQDDNEADALWIAETLREGLL